MKLLSFFLIAFLFFCSDSFAQDAQIPLQEFTLQVPQVNQLAIRPIGAPSLQPDPSDTTKTMLFQGIYYELRRTDGRVVEAGNKQIPSTIYGLVNKYITKTITSAEVSTINSFFQSADWPITAKLPN